MTRGLVYRCPRCNSTDLQCEQDAWFLPNKDWEYVELSESANQVWYCNECGEVSGHAEESTEGVASEAQWRLLEMNLVAGHRACRDCLARLSEDEGIIFVRGKVRDKWGNVPICKECWGTRKGALEKEVPTEVVDQIRKVAYRDLPPSDGDEGGQYGDDR